MAEVSAEMNLNGDTSNEGDDPDVQVPDPEVDGSQSGHSDTGRRQDYVRAQYSWNWQGNRKGDEDDSNSDSSYSSWQSWGSQWSKQSGWEESEAQAR